ncbi:RHS repeat-associated core domain-containing protein [Chitinophaga sp. HK235]|uniref:RHS repeat-associated core domain-containing protein n=1 Tax=Chitinophaga sp. HK235 TaxID=2952571 RepID=UPI001BA8AB19|nr:RHS repeat-associated core domain-containing protein [Chitinophaga sp. HK235]
MLVSNKHFTPVIGLDIHIVILLGFPVPLPHPYIGLVIDPMDYVPFIGATTKINHVPRGKSDTSGKLVFLVHIPMGGPFLMAPMIGHDSVNFYGSKKVKVEGNLMSPSGHMLMTCNDIGMPLSLSPGKKFIPIPSLYLPTSYSIPLSFGKPVMVGGPYVPDWAGVLLNLMMSYGFGALMKGLGKAGKKALTKFNHALKNKIGSNKLSKALCKKGFEPVDLVQGIVIYDGCDFELPGPIPLKWERSWNSDSPFEGLLGHGTHLGYDLRIQEFPEEDATVALLGDGRSALFDTLSYPGNSEYNRHEQLLLTRANIEEYTLFSYENRQTCTFRKLHPADKQYRLISITDERGFMISFHYNSAGHLLRIIDSAGRHLTIDSDNAGRITCVIAHHKGEKRELVRYAYNEAGDLSELIDPLGQITYMHYRDHLMVKKTDRNGASFYWEYDKKGRCIHTTGDEGLLEGWLEYQPAEGFNRITNTKGTTTYYYTADFVVSQIKDALGNSTFLEYTEDMELYRGIDPEGNVTGYTYDELGNRTSVVLPDGSTQTTLYDTSGRTILEEDATGNSRTYVYYGGNSQIHTITESIGRISIHRYNAQNLLHKIETEDGQATLLSYDDDFNLTSVLMPDDSRTTWIYDRWGRCITMTSPLDAKQEIRYDLLDRATELRLGGGNHVQVQYDAYDDITLIQDKERQICLSYTPLGKIKRREENGTSVQFIYDKEEDLTGVVNEQGETYRITRDANGNMISDTGFDGLVRHYQRDSAGKIIRIQRPGNKWTQLEYDSNGKIIRTEQHDGSWETFGYDRNGAMTEAINQYSTVRFQRDQRGRVVSEWQDGHLVNSRFDAAGCRISVTSSIGANIRFDWNNINGLTGIFARTTGQEDDWTARIERNLLGQEIARYLPGNVNGYWNYGSAGMASSHKVSVNEHITRHRQYLWDSHHRLKQVLNMLNQQLRKYGYDAENRLTWAQYENGQTGYRSPDRTGNLFETATRQDRKYSAGGRLLETNQARYTYDDEGNLIRKIVVAGITPTTWEYRWYANGLLEAVTRPDGSTVSFRYDALGRRTEKTLKNRITRFIWNADVPLHEWTYPEAERPRVTINEYGEIEWSYPEPIPLDTLTTWVFEDDNFTLSAKITGQQRYSIIGDHLGTPCEAYDETGNKVWAADMDIYGQVHTLRGDKYFIPFRYAGQYEDVETGLAYNRFRYYDASAGIYISQDPLGLDGENLNFYSYVHDNNTQIDPFGLKLVTVYHYTSKKNYNAIRSQNPIKFKASSPVKGHPKGVYVTPKSPEVLSQSTNGFKKLGLTGEKSSHFFEFQIDDSKLKSIKGDRGEFIKFIEGDLEVPKENVLRHGVTPCR